MQSKRLWLVLLQGLTLAHGTRMGLNALINDGHQSTRATLQAFAADEGAAAEQKERHIAAGEKIASSLPVGTSAGAAMIAAAATDDAVATSSSSFVVRSLAKFGDSIHARTQRRILMGEVVRTKSMKAMEGGHGWLGLLGLGAAGTLIGALVCSWSASPNHALPTRSGFNSFTDLSPFNRHSAVIYRATESPRAHGLANDRFLLGADTKETAAAAVEAEGPVADENAAARAG